VEADSSRKADGALGRVASRAVKGFPQPLGSCLSFYGRPAAAVKQDALRWLGEKGGSDA